MSEVARVMLVAVAPGAFEDPLVEACEPDAPVKSQVATTPEYGIAHVPDPVGDPVVHTALPPPVGCMHV